MITFVSVASRALISNYGALFKPDVETPIFNEAFLTVLAALHHERPETTFISPSVQNYVIYKQWRKGQSEGGFTYPHWQRRCEELILKSDSLLVLPFPNWTESQGVHAEIEFAREHGIRVEIDRVNREQYDS